MSDHEDSKVEEEEAEADESSVMSEGVNWLLETPAYKIARVPFGQQECRELIVEGSRCTLQTVRSSAKLQMGWSSGSSGFNSLGK